MKSLVEFIQENLKEAVLAEADGSAAKGTVKYVVLSFDKLDGGKDALDAVKKICAGDGVTTDTANMNDGVKITVAADKLDTLDKVVDVVQEFIDAADDKEADGIVKLAAQLDKLNDAIDSFSDDDTDTDKKDEEE